MNLYLIICLIIIVLFFIFIIINVFTKTEHLQNISGQDIQYSNVCKGTRPDCNVKECNEWMQTYIENNTEFGMPGGELIPYCVNCPHRSMKLRGIIKTVSLEDLNDRKNCYNDEECMNIIRISK